MPPPWLITTPTAPDTSSPLAVKWTKGTIPVGAIAKVTTSIIIPVFSINPANVCGTNDFIQAGPWQVGQFNYIAPSIFSIPTIPFDFINNVNYLFAVRYRVGNTCVRYLFPSQPGRDNLGPLYTGQVIQPQFSIEVFVPSGLITDLNVPSNQIILNTSILNTPTINGASLAPILTPQGGMVTTDLFTSPNIALPFNWPSDTLWNSN